MQHFATWHHLRRIRAKAATGAATRGPVHSAKQEITETVKFLVWLHETYQRTAATCTQQDVDEWLATGPTTRSAIRTFFVLAKKSRLNTQVTVQHRAAKTSRSLSQDQRLAWLHELLTGTSESLPYRVAGMLLPLYAQPLVKVVTFPTSIVDDSEPGMSIRFGTHPTDVPEPFASLIREHLATRPNLRTGAGTDSPWMFPSTLAGPATYTPTPSWTDSVISASTSLARVTEPLANSSSNALRRWLPMPSGTATRSRSRMPRRLQNPGRATRAAVSARRNARSMAPRPRRSVDRLNPHR
ncbi:hypothetical protein ACGFNV_01350 [Streptomyces sp. NPDC048751]|uniref:hypothetical protein n=1 Tax=Streptomyces sp. NPDC048751 TaxID=3365591 RepID=UPI003716FD13